MHVKRLPSCQGHIKCSVNVIYYNYDKHDIYYKDTLLSHAHFINNISF